MKAAPAAVAAVQLTDVRFSYRPGKEILRIRKQEPADVEEQETLLDLYRRALGM